MMLSSYIGIAWRLRFGPFAPAIVRLCSCATSQWSSSPAVTVLLIGTMKPAARPFDSLLPSPAYSSLSDPKRMRTSKMQSAAAGELMSFGRDICSIRRRALPLGAWGVFTLLCACMIAQDPEFIRNG